ncbi:hypothetical protein FB451DRAFT_1393652 [Mycena latifolia]|nr:hypothetical protein FB451DRAFT_1393652 [Mycena latifolia]
MANECRRDDGTLRSQPVPCDYVGPTLTRILQSLPPTNVVDTMRLRLLEKNVDLLDLREFEALILAVKMPELRHVKVHIFTPHGSQAAAAPACTDEAIMADTQKADLPLLHKKGLLSVHFN